MDAPTSSSFIGEEENGELNEEIENDICALVDGEENEEYNRENDIVSTFINSEENEEYNRENDIGSTLINSEENEEYNKENENASTSISHEEINGEHNKENKNDVPQEFPDSVDVKYKSNRRRMYYKKPIRKSNIKLQAHYVETPQEIRREQLLRYQKKNRNAAYNEARGMFEVIINSKRAEEMEVEVFEEVVVKEDLNESCEPEGMEVEKIRKVRKYTRCAAYANKLMMSEWMFEIPQDLVDKWIMVPCPVGMRTLVVAYRGSTKIYSRQGYFLYSFRSALPGGSYKTNVRYLCTILDCIWIKEKNALYVLDVIVWSNHYLVNCETDFRFFWLKSRIEEISELANVRKGINEILILNLPTINCNQDFYPFLKDISSFTIDGLLFFHKEAHYTEGRSPLVGWLKTYMLPEALGIIVPEPYDEKPSSYIDFQDHIQKIRYHQNRILENRRKKLEKRHSKLKTPEKAQDMKNENAKETESEMVQETESEKGKETENEMVQEIESEKGKETENEMVQETENEKIQDTENEMVQETENEKIQDTEKENAQCEKME